MTLEQIQDRDRYIVQPEWTPHKSRRWTVKPRVVLIHATVSRGASGTLDWFSRDESGVSSDFVIDKNGDPFRPVPKGYYSWHAGVCTFNGKPRKDYNRISYGIELVNKNDGRDPYPEEQLRAMAYVIALIQYEAPTVIHVRRHADVAVPKGRKSDPLGLSISDIYQAIHRWQPNVVLDVAR